MRRPYDLSPAQEQRYDLGDDIDGVVKRLQQVKATLQDDDGESLGLVLARLGEVNERLVLVVEGTQKALASGLVTSEHEPDDDEDDDEEDES